MTFPIVAIGASAGGLEAISDLLAALPSKSEMAYVVVQHLDPEHKSLLSELLAKRTVIPVAEIQHGLAVEPAHIYVIPPNATVTLSDERFRLTPRTSAAGRHRPVDTLFTSLAEARADAAIGVVLSGGDSDGSLGVQAIKHGGGITFAQDLQSARFPGMPKSAIETGCVDFVLRPSEIAHELGRLGSHPYFAMSTAVTPRRAPPEEVSPASEREDESFRRVFRRLRTAHGVDFTHYKRSTLRRRLARRMALRKIDELADYVTVLDDDPAEAAALYQDFLIHVTGFFRDPEAFDGLRERVFPGLEGRTSKDPIRIWVPGCASGEEVYSIAIALVEYLGERATPAGIQMFGTDLSETAIEKARAAVYLESIEQEVSSERLKRFFVKQDSHYRVAKSIRDLCIFARQDVTRDPPFSRLDLVSCRNVLIYLDAAAQRHVMQVFHYSLRPQGFLLLGPSESVGTASELFELINKHHRLYARRAKLPSAGLELGSRGAGLDSQPKEQVADGTPTFTNVDSIQWDADRLLLARYAPASLLVDEALNILQFRGETGPYLEHASGPPSLNLNRVARPELLVEIAPAIAEARESGAAVRKERLCVNDLTDVAVEVIPLKAPDAALCYLILFEDAAHRPGSRHARQAAARALPESEKDRRLAQLEREMAATREYLRVTLEEHEAVKEELKSAHEEVLSANEEFQSTNEELETAKEELQSANEELTIINEELRNRNGELSLLNSHLQKTRDISKRAQAYADAIVEAVRQGLVVLDSELRVLRANQAFHRRFKTRREDTEGRLLHEIDAGQWNIPELIGQLHAVLTTNAVVNDYEISHSFPTVGVRILRLNARKIPGDEERAELILLAVEDVTERRVNADRLREADRRKDEFLAVLAHELRNPLAPITNALHLLRRGDSGDQLPKLYDLIERQTRRLVRLVDELLDIARINRGHIELKRESLDLADVTRHAADASRARTEESRHELTLVLPETPVWVNGDPTRLEQIISNLLDNAAKYTPPGGQITLELRQESGEAVLSLRDNGIGLTPESLKTIFDLFTQVDTPLARSGGGLGIGLTLVRRLLALHGGRIEARSAGLGQGSEFIVRLPALPPGQNAPESRSDCNTKHADPAARVRRVLVVDDNADSADSMALLLRSWGHEATVARDGPEALAVSRQFQPEIALVDIGLPGMNGYELAKHLRAELRQPDLCLVALTGFGREEDREAAQAAGFDGHIVKPARIDTLKGFLASDRPTSGT